MTRYRITVEYDGGPFAGWQRQPGLPTVQQAIEQAIAGFCGETVTIQGAGRTDAGVHALAQVAHFDLSREHRPEIVRNALNFHLKPAPVSVLEAALAPEGFDARRSARQRGYLYRILNRRAPPALERGHVWHLPMALNAEAMHEAAQIMLGRHDFSSFRAAGCQANSALRTLDLIEVRREGNEIRLRARARSFLHNQIRITVGTLKLVGQGRWSAEDFAAAFAARDRRAAGPTAPPQGLVLSDVVY